MDDRNPGKSISGPYDVDILGLTSDGDEICAQVPFREDNFKYGMQMNRKLKTLKRREGGGRKLVCFWDFVSATIGGTPPRADAEPLYWEGVLLVAVGDVLRWVEEQPRYAESCSGRKGPTVDQARNTYYCPLDRPTRSGAGCF